jgi:hypothetical protein
MGRGIILLVRKNCLVCHLQRMDMSEVIRVGIPIPELPCSRLYTSVPERFEDKRYYFKSQTRFLMRFS